MYDLASHIDRLNNEQDLSFRRSEILQDFREPFEHETYAEWSDALNAELDAAGLIPQPEDFNPSYELAAADCADRHAPENWTITEIDFFGLDASYDSWL